MPTIKPYEFKTSAAGPVQREKQDGGAFGTYEAQEQGRFAKDISSASDQLMQTSREIADRDGQTEVSNLTVKMAKLQADYTTKWQEAVKTADPKDTDVARKFMEDYQNDADKLREGVATRAGQLYFDKSNSQLKSHFSVTAAAGQAELAGLNAKNNFVEANKLHVDTVTKDPGSYQTIKQRQDEDIDGLLGGYLSRAQLEEERERAHHGLVESMFRGRIEDNPWRAQAALLSGDWDKELTFKDNLDLKKQLQTEAKVAIGDRKRDLDAAQREKDRALYEKQKVIKNEFIDRLAGEGPGLSSFDIRHSILEPSEKEHFIAALDSRNKKDVPRNPALFAKVLEDIYRDPSDPKRVQTEEEIAQYAIDLQLPWKDAKQLVSVFSRRDSKEEKSKANFMRQFKSSITGSNPFMKKFDVEGDQRFHDFDTFVTEEMEKQKEAGKPVKDLFNEKSPDFLGPQVKQFMIGTPQIMKNLTERLNFDPQKAKTKPKATEEELKLGPKGYKLYKQRMKGKVGLNDEEPEIQPSPVIGSSRTGRKS